MAISLIKEKIKEIIADIEEEIDKLPKSNNKAVGKIRGWIGEIKRTIRLDDSEQGEGNNFDQGPGRKDGGR